MAPKSPHDPAEQEFERALQAFFDEQKARQQASSALRARLQKVPEANESPLERSWWRSWSMLLPLAAASLGVMLWFGPRFKERPVLVPKGTLWRILYARPRRGKTKGMLAHELKQGQRLRPGDMVQFVYQTPKPVHTLIIGINQRGEIYPLIPSKAGKSILLPKGSGVLPQQKGRASAFLLDHYIGHECFLIITAARPLSYKALRNAVGKMWRENPRLQRLQKLPGDWEVTAIVFVKVPRSPSESPQLEKRE